MNVNPFSYLIEKLKSKVSKSGDTMTGELKVDTGTSTDSIVSIGGSQNYGALRLKAGTTGKQSTLIPAVLTANRNYILPDKGGTLALTSDIPIISPHGTLNGNVLTIANALSNNEISYYTSSNNPTNCPTDCKWGSYVFFRANDKCSIFYMDKSHFACTYGIVSTDTTITWHII